tara:strand:+ start:66834 stop:67067 length:234 start_codon:yes stop_codon:yes gene_type:complete
MIQPNTILDTYGLLCPVPIIKTAEAVAQLSYGDILEVQADDDQILEDLPAWCASHGHTLVETIQDNGEFRLFVRKDT